MITGIKQGAEWFDNILVGGSDPLQSAGSITRISGAQIATHTVSGGGTVYGAAVTTGLVTNTQLVSTGSLQSQSLGVPLINIGSPSSVGNILIQAGSSATDAGSLVVVAFPRAFSAKPVVNLTSYETNEAILLKGVAAGSCVVESITASQDFMWQAIGTK